jgi:hypothetical protein
MIQYFMIDLGFFVFSRSNLIDLSADERHPGAPWKLIFVSPE